LRLGDHRGVLVARRLDVKVPARLLRRLLVAGTAVTLLSVVLAGTAPARNLFTLDPQADSIGPIVVDGAGNGYVAWLHKAAPHDATMFCRFPPGARTCAHPITLASTSSANPVFDYPSQPFAVLDPSGGVWVVENRYIANDTVIWRSTDGGGTFSGPDDIGVGCYSNLGTPDDVHWYQNSVGFVTASYNPGLGYGFSVYGETCAGQGATPGTGPGQGATGWRFADPGSGGVIGAALGFAPNQDQVEAYWLLNNPPTIEFYRYSIPNLPPGTPGDFASTLPSNWVGPLNVTDGYMPRLAGGPAGLFMLSEDQTGPATLKPSALDVRKYDTATHTFRAPLRVQAFAQSDTGLFDGGDLTENAVTGELAAVWPASSNGSWFLRAYLSGNGDAGFSPGQDVAAIGSEYAIYNSARVGIANDGQGFATFQDHDGLHVVDLTPLGGWVGLLSGSVRVVTGVASISLTCRAPRFETCAAAVSIVSRPPAGVARAAVGKARSATLASGQIRISGGKTKRIRLRLTGAARRRLAADRSRLRATLIVVIRTPSRLTTSSPVTLRGN
jgi:hypothetical protein